MAFRDCIAEAVSVKALSREEGDDLIARYEAHVKANAGDLHAGKAALEKEFRDEAARKTMLAEKAAERTDALMAHGERYRTPSGKADIVEAFKGVLDNSNNVLAGTPSVTGRARAVMGEAAGRLEEMLYETRRKFGSGKHRNLARLDNMIDEGMGIGTGDVAARDFMRAWQGVADGLIDRFNELGGQVGKLKNYVPQSHDARRLISAGQNAWKDFIRGRLDVANMHDPLTGGALTPARLEEALDVTWRRIVTDGAIDQEPSRAVTGRGALENTRQEERFLVFKDGAAWREYNAAFGRGDVLETLMGHLHGLSKDIAALEILGPNPNATVQWMNSVIAAEAAKAATGQQSLWRGKPVNAITGKLSDGTQALDALWTTVNGSPGVGSLFAANLMEATRNWLTAAQLSATTLTAVAGDPFQQAMAARFAGVPALRGYANIVRQVFDGADRRTVARAGILIEDMNAHMLDNVRGLGSWAASSREVSKYLPDRVFEWTLLSPFTRAERRANAHVAMFESADRLTQSLAEIGKDGRAGERFARQLQGFGIDADMWETIRKARPLDHAEAGGLLRPLDIINAAPGEAGAREAAYRYSEFVHHYMEQATPTGSARVRAQMGGAIAKGTVPGEVMRGGFMYLSFGWNVLTSLKRATMHEFAQGSGRGFNYAMGALGTLTLGGAAIIQLREMFNGRDPRPVNDREFWGLALVKGGGLGFWGEQVMGDYKRGSADQMARVLGPVVGFGYDVVQTVAPRALLAEDDINRADRLRRMGQNYIPVQNMWMIRPVTQRLIWDRLQEMTDEDAHAKWRRAEKKLQNDTGQGLYWPKGQALPERAPDWGKAWGE